MSLAKKVSYSLINPISYANTQTGMKNDCPFVEMTAPTSEQFNFAIKLKQGFFGTITQLAKAFTEDGLQKQLDKFNDQKTANDSQKQEVDGKGIISMLYMSAMDLPAYFETFKNLAALGAVVLPNGDKITKTLLDAFSLDDLEGLLGTYLENFIVGSLSLKK